MSNSDVFKVLIPKGTHLAASKAGDGGFLGALLDNSTNQVVGQARLFKVPAGSDVGSKVVVAALSVAAGVAVTVAIYKAPQIQNWWKTKGAPGILASLAWLADVDIDEYQRVAPTEVEVTPVSTREFSDTVGAVIEDFRQDMTNAEFQQRLLSNYLAAAIIAENLRKLTNARVADPDFVALQSAMEGLTSGQIVDSLNELLSSNELVLDEQTRTIFADVFHGGRVVDGEYEPIILEKIEDALRLPGAAESERGSGRPVSDDQRTDGDV